MLCGMKKEYPQTVFPGPCFCVASSTGDAGQVGWLEIEKAGFGEDCGNGWWPTGGGVGRARDYKLLQLMPGWK